MKKQLSQVQNPMKNRKKSINVGIVCSPWLGGSGVVGSELAKYLSKNPKYNVIYIADALSFRLEDEDVTFHKVEKLSHALFTHPLTEAALTENIVEAALKYKLDIIHAHFAIPYAHCAVQAKEILKDMGVQVQVVTTLHGTDVVHLGPEAPATMRYILEQSDVVTAVSMSLAIKTKKMYGVKKDIHVVYNFVDFDQFAKLRASNALRSKFAKPGEKVFVHISNFRPVKRIQDTLKVFSQVHEKIPSVLLLIGEGPDMVAAKKMAKSLKKQKAIHFVGRVKNPYRYLKAADALIMTSEYESFCLAALEAMAIGVPVFGSKVGGLPEVVTHAKAGYLAKLGDVEKLSEYMIKHFSSNGHAKDLCNNAKQLSKRFAAEQIIPEYENIYNQLLLSKVLKKNFKPIGVFV